MGNNNSLLKGRRLKIPKLPEDPQTKSGEERQLNYYLSCDVDAIDRLHMMHFVRRCMFQGNFSSPVGNKLTQEGYKVLDVGCGSGAWLLDLSTKYENAHFFGLDFQEIYPLEIKPPNLKFIKADILDGLPFPDNEFDFVQQCNMGQVFSGDQLLRFVLPEIIRVTKPGGYIELCETYFTFIDSGPVLCKIFNGINSALFKQGVNSNEMANLEPIFESQSGITQIYREEKEFIIGPNGDKVGMVCQEAFEIFCLTEMNVELLSSEMQVSKEEFRHMIRKELRGELNESRPKCIIYKLWAKKGNI